MVWSWSEVSGEVTTKYAYEAIAFALWNIDVVKQSTKINQSITNAFKHNENG